MKTLKLILVSTAIVFAMACNSKSKADEAASAIPLGSYECWGNGSPRMLLNFTVTSVGHYRASDGSNGIFTYDPATTVIAFTGYEGQVMPEGFKTIFHTPQGLPTVSFYGPSGAEASFCQLQK